MQYFFFIFLTVLFIFLLIYVIRIYKEDKPIREMGKKLKKEEEEERLSRKIRK